MTAINVLIVDDSRAMRKVVSQTLGGVTNDELAFMEAADGKQAIEALQDNEIDLLFLDINMPVMNGYDVLTWLNTRDEGPYTVVVTSNNTADLVKKAGDLGADSYLVKPFNLEGFMSVMERYRASEKSARESDRSDTSNKKDDSIWVA